MEMKFEEALNKLEEIVRELEQGSLDLDNALKRFEEGIRLARMCGKKLSDTEKRIEIIKKGEKGESLPLELFRGLPDGENR